MNEMQWNEKWFILIVRIVDEVLELPILALE